MIKSFSGMITHSSDIMDYARGNQLTFFTIEEWESFYAKNNVSFAWGTRFHGNMAALQNGVPALWVNHDSRTRELT